MIDPRDYIVTDQSVFVDGDADLDSLQARWPDGTPLTEESTSDYSVAQKHAGGRPSLHGGKGSTPTLAIRIPDSLRKRVEKRAVAEGRPLSALARQALEDYLVAHADGRSHGGLPIR